MSMSRLKLGGPKWPFPLYSKRLCSSKVARKVPKYPPILDESPLAKKLRRKEDWHNWLKSHDTVEEKLFEINMPKFYGWKSVMIRENSIPYDFLPYSLFATRTHLEVVDQVPHFYADVLLDEKAANLAKEVRSEVEDVILFEHLHTKRADNFALVPDDNKKGSVQVADKVLASFMKHLNRVLINNLLAESPHLKMITVVPDPRLEAFWFLGGINPSQEKLEERRLRTKLKHFTLNKGFLDPSLVDGPVNEPVQYLGQPLLHIRSKYPLPAVEKLMSSHPLAKSIPHVPYEPTAIHLDQNYRHGTTVPGFWPGDAHEFGLMSFHSSNYLCERPPDFGSDEHQDAMHSSAIFASYAWLLGQACYQGFSTFHDPTYPLVTQTIFTNGREWSFYLYQLNTTLLHTKNSTENPRCNLCWGTKPMKLYHGIESGHVTGFDEDVLKQIIKLYLIKTHHQEGLNYKPYLSEKPHVADIDYEERRDWLERHYKDLTSNRPKHREKPEMWAWEYLYKVKYNFYVQEPRRKWFQLQGPPPDCMRLDDCTDEYKPKILRTEEDRLDLRKHYRNFYPGTNKVPETLFYLKPKPAKKD